MMYKLVIFDMDGTIMDTDLLVVEAWRRMYARFRPGYKPQLMKMVYFSGPPITESIPKEFPDEKPETVIRYLKSISKKLYDETVVAYPGCIECVKALREKGILTAVNTNKLHEFSVYALRCCGEEGLFDFLIAGGDVPRMKPAPGGVVKAMELAKVFDKKEVLYVGDTVYDWQTAQNAGVDCLLVTWGPRKVPSEAKARYYCDDFKNFFEVTGL
jgi:phosphoglycolate phosphatase-like HAD superfamily hydrolase